MKLSTLVTFALTAVVPLAQAHTTVWGVWINGKEQAMSQPGDRPKYIRTPPNTDPVMDFKSANMRCNVNGAKPAPQTLQVKGGDTVTFEWHHLSRKSTDLIVDPSHAGPVMVYIAPAENDGDGDVWVKLFEDNYSNDRWGTHKLRDAKGLHSIIVPDLKAGKYILRPEQLALHESQTLYPKLGVQFYMECVQIEITSNGSVTLPKGIAIPGNYKADSPGIVFDMYRGKTNNRKYKAPGGEVWSGSPGGAFGKTVSGSNINTTKPTATSAANSEEETTVATTTSSADEEEETGSSEEYGDDYEDDEGGDDEEEEDDTETGATTVKTTSTKVAATDSPTETTTKSRHSCRRSSRARALGKRRLRY